MPGIWPLLVVLCSAPTSNEAPEPATEPAPRMIVIVEWQPEDFDDPLAEAMLRTPPPPRCPSLFWEVSHLRSGFFAVMARQASGMLGNPVSRSDP